MAGPSIWWATPSDPSLWFGSEERAASRRYHRPILRAGVARWTARVAGLVIVAVVGDALGVWTAATAVAIAWWWPATAAEAWHEYRHEPRFGGDSPLPPAVFAASSVSMLVGQFVVALAASWALVTFDVAVLVASATVVAVAVPAGALLFGPSIARSSHGAEPVSADAEARLRRLAEAAGTPTARFLVMTPESGAAPTAFAAGIGARAVVCVSSELLEPGSPIADHIVGHELSHLRRRHSVSSMLAASLLAATVLVVGTVVAVELRDDAGRLPMLLLVGAVGGALTQPFFAWIGRAHERRADLDAIERLDTDAAAMRDLFVSERVLLDPSRWVRLVAGHPSPAERLELLRRGRSNRRTGAGAAGTEGTESVSRLPLL